MSASPPANDASLLAEYIASASESAFRQIVDRHLPMVLSAARRQLRDVPLADDVAQAVFILLARKAHSVRRPELLAGWLLKATHFACRDARKLQHRRAFHERKAAQMTPEQVHFADPAPDTQPLSHVLDDSMAALSDADRTALAVRFLQGRAMADVGAALGVSEAAAAKRIERALVKLRGLFHRRGVALPLAGLATAVVAAGQASAAPAGFVEKVYLSAMSASQGVSGASASALAIAKGTGQIMAIAKVKVVAAVVIASATAVGVGVAAHHIQLSAHANSSTRQIAVSPAITTPSVEPASPVAQSATGIMGTVKYRGAPPIRKPIDTSSVRDIDFKEPLLDERLIVGASGGLANAVVSIKRIEGQVLPGDDTTPPAPVVLDQKGCQYIPHVLAVQVGQTVQAKNSDPFLHNVHTQPSQNAPDNIAQPNVNSGTKLKTPTDPEYVHVKCDIHPWMSAWIAVIDNRFFAVTDANGNFALPSGLADGQYTLHVWHEKLGEQDVPLEVQRGRAHVELIYNP